MSKLSELSQRLYGLEQDFVTLLVNIRKIRDEIHSLETRAEIKAREIDFDDPLGLKTGCSDRVSVTQKFGAVGADYPIYEGPNYRKLPI